MSERWVEADFSALEGQTIAHIIGLKRDSELVAIVTAEGNAYRMTHHQDCCEHVRLVDDHPEAFDLCGARVRMAREVSHEFTDGPVESATWTFYILHTDKCAVTMRWLGESNGYYSERVAFEHKVVE